MLTLDEIFEQFENDKGVKVTEIILLGESGHIRRVIFEDDKIRYIG